jgi:3D (Asp-Asp-Asp) domain-containing protein/chromosome segregation ATPase
VSRAVRRRRERRLAAGLAVGAALLAGSFLPNADGASPKQLKERQAQIAVRSHSALLGLYALDSRLAEARSGLAALRSQAASIRAQQQQVRREAAVVAGNLRASERLLGDRLRTIYEEGEPDAIAVLLGATSLDDAVTRLNDLEQSAKQGADAAQSARDGREQLRGLGIQLAARAREIRALAAEAERTASALASARAHRLAYLASLRRQSRLTKRQLATLESRARVVVAKAQQVESATRSTDSQAAPASVLVGPRTVTVTATGYSLPGHTSTGLPVSLGVVAVDPSVIPLGTRLTIPGYGEGVAADTGSAVRGLTIDLWFPTLARAMAWGKRTVTITLH